LKLGDGDNRDVGDIVWGESRVLDQDKTILGLRYDNADGTKTAASFVVDREMITSTPADAGSDERKTGRNRKLGETHTTVVFKSGLRQVVDRIDEDGEMYTLTWRDQSWPVKKALIEQIVKPGETSESD